MKRGLSRSPPTPRILDRVLEREERDAKLSTCNDVDDGLFSHVFEQFSPTKHTTSELSYSELSSEHAEWVDSLLVKDSPPPENSDTPHHFQSQPTTGVDVGEKKPARSSSPFYIPKIPIPDHFLAHPTSLVHSQTNTPLSSSGTFSRENLLASPGCDFRLDDACDEEFEGLRVGEEERPSYCPDEASTPRMNDTNDVPLTGSETPSICPDQACTPRMNDVSVAKARRTKFPERLLELTKSHPQTIQALSGWNISSDVFEACCEHHNYRPPTEVRAGPDYAPVRENLHVFCVNNRQELLGIMNIQKFPSFTKSCRNWGIFTVPRTDGSCHYVFNRYLNLEYRPPQNDALRAIGR